MKYALDTNIIIHLILQNPNVVAGYIHAVEKNTEIVIPPYVDFEIRKGLEYKKAAAKMKAYLELCNCCKVGDMRKDVWIYAADLYANLRRNGFTVADPDIIIAAFCIVDGFTLVTNNTKDFSCISYL